jgi:hypothetical protein
MPVAKVCVCECVGVCVCVCVCVCERERERVSVDAKVKWRRTSNIHTCIGKAWACSTWLASHMLGCVACRRNGLAIGAARRAGGGEQGAVNIMTHLVIRCSEHCHTSMWTREDRATVNTRGHVWALPVLGSNGLIHSSQGSQTRPMQRLGGRSMRPLC